MSTARFFLGASLFTLLIVDICCIPLKQAPGYNANAAPYLGSSQSAPVAVAFPHNAPSKGVSEPAYPPAQQWEPSSAQTGVQREPAASFGYSSPSSGPALSGYSGSSVRKSPASSTQPGAAFQPASRDINWVVAPPSFSSAGEGMSGVGSSRPENVSPPGPVYQAGELTHLEEAFENGDYQMETEEQGGLSPVPPPVPVAAGQGFTGKGFTSQPQPESSIGGGWNIYPYYDYMFLTGQYPPGTFSHYSSSNEQGSDNWQDVHYIRYHYPDNPGPEQPETVAVSQSFDVPRLSVKRPVMAPYGQGGATGGVSAPSGSQAGGYNPGKGYGY